MPPARRFNWPLVAAILGASAVLGVGLRAVHGWQLDRHTRTIHDQVAAAEAAGRPGDAIEALERYLALNPGHTDSLAKLGRLLDQVADSPVGWSRALAVNEKVLAGDVTNAALRRRVAELALKVRDLELAHEHLTTLWHARGDDVEVANRIGDVLLAAGRTDDAIRAFRDSVKADPNQTLPYGRLAAIYLALEGEPTLAEETVDAMVAAQPEKAGPYLERGHFYRAVGRTQDAANDFAKARTLAGDDPEPLLALAELALARGRHDEARRLLDEGRAAHPDRPTWYRHLAELALLQHKPDEALRWLEDGLKVAPKDADLWQLRIETARQKDDLTAARADAAKLRDLPGVTPGLAELIDARLQLYQGEGRRAVERLVALRGDLRLSPWLRARAAVALAEAAVVLGEPDRQFAELRRAVHLDPSHYPAWVWICRLLLEQGKPDEARDLLKRVLKEPDPPAEAHLLFARASLQRQLGRPESERNWSEPLDALRPIERLAAWAVEAALVRAEVLLAQGKGDAAEAALAEATKTYPADARGWAARAALARRLGDPALARRIEAEGLKVVADPTALLLGAARSDDKAARDALEARLATLPRPARIGLLQALGTTAPDPAARLLADVRPADGQSLGAALDLALLGQDAALVEKILAALLEVDGPDSAAARFGTAAWQVRAGGSRAEARTALEQLARDRPTWAAPVAWLGRLADAEGRPADAARLYRQAFDLGDRSPGVSLRLVRLLVEKGDFDQADKVFRQVERTAQPTGELARLGAEIALHNVETDRALRLAEKAKPAGPPTAGDLLWRAGFLARAGEVRDALAAARQAVRLNPVDPDGWALLVELLVKSNRQAEADAVFADLRQRQPADLHAVTLAQCEAHLGRHDRAAAYFDQAVRRAPDDVYTLLKAAAFQVERKNAEAARPLLERLRQLAPRMPEDRARWVEERLAALG